MAEAHTITALVGAFIAAAIIFGIGIQILGNVQNSSGNCQGLPGFNSTGTSRTPYTAYTNIPNDKFSGWALTCLSNNSQIQNAYGLLLVAIIIIAAVVIMFVVRML